MIGADLSSSTREAEGTPTILQTTREERKEKRYISGKALLVARSKTSVQFALTVKV
jgi:hypothetical protein